MSQRCISLAPSLPSIRARTVPDHRLRIADEWDLPLLAAVINEAYEIAESEFVDGPRATAQELRDKLRHGTFLLADGGNGVAHGLVYVSVAGPVGQFGPLAVRPGLQGTGLGNRLIEAAERHCRDAGCREIEIDVVNHRTVLVDYYGRRGYVVTGQRPFPDDPPVKLPTHFVVMRKLLSPE